MGWHRSGSESLQVSHLTVAGHGALALLFVW